MKAEEETRFVSLAAPREQCDEYQFLRFRFGELFTIARAFVLTLNNEKSALISLLDDCDELVAIDDIGDSSSSIFLQVSSSFCWLLAFDLLAVGGNTANRRASIGN